MTIPAHITAGDSVSWREEAFSLQGGFISVAPPAWGLSLALRGPLATGLDLAATVDAGGWRFDIAAAQSAALNAGPATLVWYWQLSATQAAQRKTAKRGVLRVMPNLAVLSTGTTFDGRSQAEQTLTAIEAEVSARLNGGAVVEYTIHGRNLRKETLAELMALRKQYRQIVRLERNRGKASDIQSTQIRFARS